ncbi:MAG TPA: amidohydrolase family protein [Thermoanaerobaculia bacterium]|jgi:beta-aspartyl-dipeptidase (metallo-type)|nr:amidohydrolase family protein [Thermoanaerobaculia bacterium]
MLLVENAEVFAPAPLGRRSLLLAGGSIEAVGVDGGVLARCGIELETLDAAGCLAMPGLIDPHAHLIGGSGEQGFASQTPELSASELLRGGITTVVGTLGADTSTRTMRALLGKVKSLRDEGLAAYAWSGGYDARPLLDSLGDDITLIEEIIGAGEVAIADARGPQLDAARLARLAAQCFVAGTLTGKAGLLHLHVGPGERRLAVVRELLERFDVAPSTLYLTHVERDEPLMSEAIELARRGMPIDCDVHEEDLPRWIRFYREHDGDPALITASSDAGSKSPHMLFEQVMRCAREDMQAIAVATSNTARILKLDAGRLAPGRRADVLLVDADSLALRHVICNGRLVMRDGAVLLRERFLAESNRNIRLMGRKATT